MLSIEYHRSVLKQRHVSGIRRTSILKCLGRRSVETTPRNPFVGDLRRNAGRGAALKSDVTVADASTSSLGF
jgi:hypothetical protein